jgi:hypothetical protein
MNRVPLVLLSLTIGDRLCADQTIYTDSLQNGWVDYSWATVSFTNTTQHHSGSDSISVSSTYYQALYLHHSAQPGNLFNNLTFWINGGTGGQSVQVQVTINGVAQTAVTLAALPAGSWRQDTISLSSLGVAGANFDGFWMQVNNSGTAPTFYVDDITLTSATNTSITNAPLTIGIDANLNRHPINPLIYGVAFASSNQLSDLNSPLHRSGGNSESRYNWQIDAHNHAADFYYESIADSSGTPGASTDGFVADTKNGGAQAMVSIPMIGWAPKLGPARGKLASYSISKYGPQTGNDSLYFPDAGNGISTTNGTPITWNNPNDANTPVDSTFEQGYVRHLTNTWGSSTNGGVRYYIMDNEHTLWHSTHQDIHPLGTTMQEIRDKMIQYASMVKSNDPNALVCGPEEWSWPGYFYSGYDQQWSGANSDYNTAHYPDRSSNGGWDYVPWLLDQIHRNDTNTGKRLLDCLTVHCYPQENNVGSTAVDSATILLRNASTRQFWDTNYVDPSWINSIIMLIPRMKSWVTNYYPGTQIGITEYNFGAEPDINGATTQADIYGIFGREGLALATRWTTPDATTPTYKAMKMFRNYDGSKSTFGDASIFVNGSNPDNTSVFAAVRTNDNAMTIMAINKPVGQSTPVRFSLTNFLAGGVAQVWQLTSANTISHLSNIAFVGGTFSNTLPAQSVTLFVIPAGTRPNLRSIGISTNNTFKFWLDGQAGQRYAILETTNFVNWNPIQTNSPVSNSISLSVTSTNRLRFLRAQWLP